VRETEPRRRRDSASEVDAQREQRRREAEERRDAARGTAARASEVRQNGSSVGAKERHFYCADVKNGYRSPNVESQPQRKEQRKQ
jgi:hypothetical protein